MPMFESEPETIGTYKSDQIGNFLREGLSEKYPKTEIEVVPVHREGHALFDMIVTRRACSGCCRRGRSHRRISQAVMGSVLEPMFKLSLIAGICTGVVGGVTSESTR